MTGSMAQGTKWEPSTLGEISTDIAYGYTASASAKEIGPKFLRITDIQTEFIDWDSVPFCRIDKSKLEKYILEVGDIVVARTGNSTGATAVIKKPVNAVFASYLIRYKLDAQKADFRFIDFVLRSPTWSAFVKSNLGGSAQAGANAKVFAAFPLFLPPLPEQKAIAALLSSLDDKIESLRWQNETLEEIAIAVFKEWFIEFNFPDKDGNPYKASGGKMVDSELDPIPAGWKVGTVADVVNIYDSKRVPLSGEVRAKRRGIYPYYGATTIMDYIDDFLFDGVYLLLAEDGSVVTEDGFPVLQYVWGKFWVNNHTHVLQGREEYSTEILYLYFRQKPVSEIITGAVQLKINQGNLLGVDICIPGNLVLRQFNELTAPLFDKMRANTDQIANLSKICDTLLPKLMNGELRVGG